MTMHKASDKWNIEAYLRGMSIFLRSWLFRLEEAPIGCQSSKPQRNQRKQESCQGRDDCFELQRGGSGCLNLKTGNLRNTRERVREQDRQFAKHQPINNVTSDQEDGKMGAMI